MNIPCNRVCPYNTLRGCTILEHPGEYCPMGNMAKKEYKPFTNGDRIRAMTDEEQAHFLVGVQLDAMRFERHKTKPFAESVDEWINWLKQRAEEVTCIQSDM